MGVSHGAAGRCNAGEVRGSGFEVRGNPTSNPELRLDIENEGNAARAHVADVPDCAPKVLAIARFEHHRLADDIGPLRLRNETAAPHWLRAVRLGRLAFLAIQTINDITVAASGWPPISHVPEDARDAIEFRADHNHAFLRNVLRPDTTHICAFVSHLCPVVVRVPIALFNRTSRQSAASPPSFSICVNGNEWRFVMRSPKMTMVQRVNAAEHTETRPGVGRVSICCLPPAAR